MVLKNGKVQTAFYPCFRRGCSEVFIVLGEFVADGEPLLILTELAEAAGVSQLLAPRLRRKVSLSVGNHRLARVAVLDDQITGIA